MALTVEVLSPDRIVKQVGEKLVGDDKYPIIEGKVSDGSGVTTWSSLSLGTKVGWVIMGVDGVDSEPADPNYVNLDTDDVRGLYDPDGNYQPGFTEIVTSGQQIVGRIDDYKDNSEFIISGNVFGILNGQQPYEGLRVLLITGNSQPYNGVEETVTDANGDFSFTRNMSTGTTVSVCVPSLSWSGATILDSELRGKLTVDFVNLKQYGVYGETKSHINSSVYMNPPQSLNSSAIMRYGATFGDFLQYHVIIQDDISGNNKVNVWLVRNKGWGTDPDNLPQSAPIDLDDTITPIHFFLAPISNTSSLQLMSNRLNDGPSQTSAMTTFVQTYADFVSLGFTGTGAELHVSCVDGAGLSQWIDDYVNLSTYGTADYTYDTGEIL